MVVKHEKNFFIDINVDTKNMPTYLSWQLFDSWVSDWCVGGLMRVPFLDVNVSFSREKKTDCYGVLSMEKAKEEIKSLFPKDVEITTWLEERLAPIETQDELWDRAEDLAFGSVVREKCDGKNIFKRVREIASAVKFSVARLGEYRHAEHEIVLYTNSIERACKNDVVQLFEEVFAHELFHAFHYHFLKSCLNDNDIIFRTDATRRVVLESLASYFELWYCQQHGISTDLLSTWERNEPAFYPYAGAKYIKDNQLYL